MSDNATAVRSFSKRRSKLMLSSIHKSCNLQNDCFECDGLGKSHKNAYSSICQTLFSFPLLKSMRCTKTISRSGIHSRPRGCTSFGDDLRSAASGDENAGREYQKSLLTAHSVMEMCCSCFINTKINDRDADCLLAITAQCLKKTRT